jgi:hypothetical protein
MPNQKKQTQKRKIILLTALLVLSSLAFAGAITTNQLQTSTAQARIAPSTGNIGIYSDSTCTQKISNLNWGAIPQGAQANKTVYLKNQCTTTLKLSMTTSNWSPTSAYGQIRVSWGSEGLILKPNQVIAATIRIVVASNSTVTSFNMNIAISGASTK